MLITSREFSNRVVEVFDTPDGNVYEIKVIWCEEPVKIEKFKADARMVKLIDLFTRR